MRESKMDVPSHENTIALTRDLADRIYTLFNRCLEIVPEEAPFSPNNKVCADRFIRCVLAMLDQVDSIPFDPSGKVAEFNLRSTLDGLVYAYDCNDIFLDLTLETMYVLMVVMKISGYSEMREYCLENIHEVVL